MKERFTSQKATPGGGLPGISRILSKVLLLTFMVAGLAILTGRAWGQSTYTPGSYTVAVDNGATVTIEAWGGGGAGGDAEAMTLLELLQMARAGAGGGGGAYSTLIYQNTTGGTVTLNITVGAGGQSGVNSGNGYASTVSIFDGSTTTLVVQADGGSAGASNTSGGSPAGGAGGNGSLPLLGFSPGSSGGNGGVGMFVVTGSGGAGGQPGGGAGGPGFDTFGNTQNGNPGTAPGGGGSGARVSDLNNSDRTGGNGGDGQVVITMGMLPCTNPATLTLQTAGTDNQKLCGPGSITPIVYTVGGGATGVEVTGISFSGIIATFDDPSNTLTLTGTASGTIDYIVTTIGSASNCTEASATGTITVYEVPVVTIDEEVICEGSTTNAYPATGGTWTSTDASVADVDDTGLVTGVAPGTATLTYFASVSGCSASLSVTVAPKPTLDWISGTTTPTVCQTFAIDPITYTFGGGATGATLDPGVTGLGGVVSGTDFIVSGTPVASGTFTVTTSGSSPCDEVSLTGTVTMIPTPTLALTGGTDSQTVCQTVDPIDDITYTFGGGATGLAITWGGDWSGLTFTQTAADAYTISGAPTAYGTITYVVTTTGMEPCAPLTMTGTITVIEKPILYLTSAPGTDDQELCGPGPIVDITYYWDGGANQINFDGLNLEPNLHVSVTDNPGGGQDIRIYGAVSNTVNYTIFTGGAVDPPCQNITVTGTITVWELPDTPTITGDDKVCAESTALYTTEEGMHDYLWSVTGGSFVGDTNTNTVTVAWGTGAVGTLTVTYKDIHDCSPLEAGLLEVTIDALPVVSFGFNEVEAGHNPTFTYCYPTELSVDLHHIYAGTAPFSVTYNIDGGAATTVTDLGEHGVIGVATLEPGVHTITVTDVEDANGCHANAQFLSWCVATVVINPQPMVSFGFNGVEAGWNATFTYCWDEVIKVTIFAKYAGTESFTVYYNVDGGSTMSFTGNVGDLIASQTLAPGTHTITVTDLVDGNGCHASAEYLGHCVATVIINPEPLVSFAFNGEEAGWNDSFTFCENDLIEVTLFKNYQGTAPFTVIYNIDGGASVTVTALDEGDLVGSSSTLVPGTHTITVEDIIDANGCHASQEFLAHCVCTIVINPDATLVLEPGSGAKDQWICLGEDIKPIIFRINGGANGFDLSVIKMGSLNVEGDIDGDDLIVTISGTTSETVSYVLWTDGTLEPCTEESATINVVVNYIPTFTVCSANIVKNTDLNMCSAVATYDALAVGSVSPAITYSYTINLATGGTVTGTGTGSGYAFPVGTSTVTIVAANICGTAQCVFTVKVIDNQIPQITCKSGNATTDPGQPTFMVKVAGWDPDIVENCSYVVTNTKTGGATLSGTTFPIGTTQVVWTVTDASGNAASCVSTYVIADNELPVIACTVSGTVTMTSDPGKCYYKVKGVEFDIASASDNSGSLTKYYKINNGGWVQANSLVNYQFSGTTLVTWGVKDPSNNWATCSFTVVVTDNQKPTFSKCGETFCVTLKPTIVRNRFGVFISATGYLYDSMIRPYLWDNCTDKANIKVTYSRTTTYTDADAGANLVKVYFEDAAGNKDSCCIIVDVPLPFEKSGVIGNNSIESDVYSDLNMTVYPNPTKGKLYLDIQNLNDPKVVAKVFNATGSLVLNKEITTDGRIELDLNGNVSGMYMLQVTADKKQFMHKIILE